MQLVDVYRARIVDVSPESLVIETTGTEDKIDSLLEVLRPYGVDRDGADRPRRDGARDRAGAPSRAANRVGVDGSGHQRRRQQLFGVDTRRSREAFGRLAIARLKPSTLPMAMTRLPMQEIIMATMYYDDAADLALIRGEEGRRSSATDRRGTRTR